MGVFQSEKCPFFVLDPVAQYLLSLGNGVLDYILTAAVEIPFAEKYPNPPAMFPRQFCGILRKMFPPNETAWS